jgi:hypothetical protein
VLRQKSSFPWSRWLRETKPDREKARVAGPVLRGKWVQPPLAFSPAGMEVAFARRPSTLESVVGMPWEGSARWGPGRHFGGRRRRGGQRVALNFLPGDDDMFPGRGPPEGSGPTAGVTLAGGVGRVTEDFLDLLICQTRAGWSHGGWTARGWRVKWKVLACSFPGRCQGNSTASAVDRSSNLEAQPPHDPRAPGTR